MVFTIQFCIFFFFFFCWGTIHDSKVGGGGAKSRCTIHGIKGYFWNLVI